MTRPLWTLAEIVAATRATLDLPRADAKWASEAQAKSATIAGISIDTRTLEPVDLFVPLTDIRDGHEFVSQAFTKGAIAALVRESYERRASDGILVRVDDPLRALERIGIAARARLSDTARVIAVTGSAGKTGTKEMLRACLRACASSPNKVHAPEKSFNNHWGVPLTLARMPADTEFGVYEIGMNHAGEIRPLTKMVRPHLAIVTNVLPVHVGNFPDGEIGVANAKAEIFEGLEPKGTAIILRDSPHYERLREAAANRSAQVRTFGRHEEADVRLVAVSGEQPNGTQWVQAESRRRTIGFELGMLGEHLAINAMAVVTALDVLGIEIAEASSALASVSAAAGRGARHRIRAGEGQILLLDESYNANPASLAAALANLEALDHDGRRIAVLGDMLELGTDAVRYHVGLREAAGRADLVFCCGPNMKHLFDMLPDEKRGAWTANSSGLVDVVPSALRPGDAVMVKGSLGSRMAPIVEAIKKHFADG
ncbi:MAG: UDP-N-acetylmuramoyl-tripeptide--D-alanyl-D-alanine ligase [Hyphomicrobiaceae bacterium]